VSSSHAGHICLLQEKRYCLLAFKAARRAFT